MCLRRLVLLGVVSFLLANAAVAQQYAYQVNFKNKNGTVSINNPLAFLSQRALDRRARLGITIDSSDLPVSPVYVDSVLSVTGGVLHVTSRWLNFCVLLLSDSTQIHTLDNISFVTGYKFVGYYSPNLHNRVEGFMTVAARTLRTVPQAKTTGSAAYYGNTYLQTALVNGDYLHDNGFKGQGELIAILDEGFVGTDTHPGFDSLRQSGRIVDTHDFVHNTGSVYGYDDHGTSALSTMAGNMPGTYVGTAPQAEYALYITEAAGEQPVELDNMIAGVERADSVGADVLSVSLGYDTFDNPIFNFNFATDFDGKSTIAAKAANIATSKGVLFVASAGNEGDGVPGWGNHILTPGDADSALTIGAVDINGIPASFSGYGPNAAGQIKPDVCDYGVSVPVFYSSTIISEDGTSFATPQIAGWAACLLQTNPNATPYMIRNAIDVSADHYNNPGNQIGYGVPDFRRALQILNVNDTPSPNGNWATIYPNPFTDMMFVSVTVPQAQVLKFRLVDAAGRQVFSTQQLVSAGFTPDIELSVGSSLASGVYLLKIIGDGKQEIIKVLKH